MASEALLRLTVVYAPAPRQVEEIQLTMAAPCSVLLALQQSGLVARFPELLEPGVLYGVWGRKVAPEQLLRDRDRVEAYRPLRVDPKVARRERFARQGARAAGLFVKRKNPARSAP